MRPTDPEAANHPARSRRGIPYGGTPHCSGVATMTRVVRASVWLVIVAAVLAACVLALGTGIGLGWLFWQAVGGQ